MIYNEDCLEGMKRIPDKSVDSVICDPPYFTGMTHGYDEKARLLDLNICRPFYQQVYEEIKRILTAAGSLYWFCDWRSMGFYLSAMESARLPVKNCLIWDKGGGIGNYYRFTHEMILFATFNKQFRGPVGANIISGIPGFSYNARIDGGKVHQAQKPIALIEKLIKDSSREGDTVLDSFMGSGTTGVACVNLNRRLIGFELDAGYFEIAKKRIDEAIAQREQSLFR